jgi:uroporphyrinogen-III decarboxylase
VSGAAEEDVLQMFFKERKLSGDIISKASDIFWQREVKQFVDADANAVKPADTPQQAEQVQWVFFFFNVPISSFLKVA